MLASIVCETAADSPGVNLTLELIEVEELAKLKSTPDGKIATDTIRLAQTNRAELDTFDGKVGKKYTLTLQEAK